MDELRIDSHKLMYHLDRVNEWQKDIAVAPIYMEIAPFGGCNHRCIFCALDYMGYKPSELDAAVLKKAVKDASNIGVKSIMYAGEGEPLLHKDIKEIVSFTKRSNIDAAITTNGVFLKDGIIKAVLKDLSWIRISFNAGSSKTYEKVHRCLKGDFEKTLSNLQKAVKFKRRHKLECTIGVQILLIQENKNEVIRLARILRDIGVDYLTVKPFSRHPMSGSYKNRKMDYSNMLHLEKKLEKMNSGNFKIVFRRHTMNKLNKSRGYKHCLGLPFWSYIDACGNVYACSAYLNDKRFLFGNIYKDRFSEILNGKKRKAILNMAAKKLNTVKCREICRLDEINRYLWMLKNPSKHVNFI